MDVYVARNGKQEGPFAADQIVEMIRSRKLLQTDLVWHQELPEWRQASSVFDFLEEPVAPLQATRTKPSSPPPHSGSSAPALRLAGRGARLGAVVVDGVFACLVAMPGLLLTLALTFLVGGGNGLGIFVLAVCLLCLALYQAFLLSRDGQTLGKRVFRVMIVTADTEGNAGFVKAVLLRIVVVALLQSIPVAGGIFALVDILFIFREDRRCIHDLIAGTKVVAMDGRM